MANFEKTKKNIKPINSACSLPATRGPLYAVCLDYTAVFALLLPLFSCWSPAELYLCIAGRGTALHKAVMGTAVAARGALFAFYNLTQLAEYKRKQVRVSQVLQSNA